MHNMNYPMKIEVAARYNPAKRPNLSIKNPPIGAIKALTSDITAKSIPNFALEACRADSVSTFIALS